MEIDDAPPPSSTGGKGKDADADAYESPSLDKTFRRFADRLAQNPMQVLRYEFGGSPLLYSKFDPVGKLLFSSSSPASASTSSTINSSSNKKITITTPFAKTGMPPCENCTAPRVFELQLTPQTIAELEAEDEMSLEGMDWGSVILGVCSRDCVPRGPEGLDGRAEGKVGYVEEWIGVQWEETGGPGTGAGRR